MRVQTEWSRVPPQKDPEVWWGRWAADSTLRPVRSSPGQGTRWVVGQSPVLLRAPCLLQQPGEGAVLMMLGREPWGEAEGRGAAQGLRL